MKAHFEAGGIKISKYKFWKYTIQPITSILWHSKIHILLTCKIYIHSIPTFPKVLIISISILSPKSHLIVNSKTQISWSNSPKLVVGETWSLGAKFLFTCKPVKPNELPASKIQWWDRHRMDLSIPKRKNKKKKTGHKSQACLTPSRASFVRF